jgi:mannose-6-phosphate isomerase-like protein (cupin superfamily)
MTTNDFLKLDPQVVSKDWGEERIFYNGNYCSKCLIIAPGASTSFHYHPLKDETMTVVSGSAQIRVGDYTNYTEYFLSDLDSVRIPPGVSHKIYNSSNSKKLIIMESSTHDDPIDSIRI